MTVQAVVGDVELAAGEPLIERRVVVVEHPGPLLEPVQLLGLGGPPGLWVKCGLSIDSGIFQQSALAELLGGSKVSTSSKAASSASSSPPVAASDSGVMT